MTKKTTKLFALENVLTVYTGVCMKTGIGVAQDVFNHLYPGIMTLGCAAKQTEAARELERQHPPLARIRPIKPGTTDYIRYLDEARDLFGDSMAVEGPLSDEETGLGLELEYLASRRAGKGTPR